MSISITRNQLKKRGRTSPSRWAAGTIKQIAAGAIRLPGRIHRDERGTISIITVFAVMLLTMLLGMVMNVGRQVDGKIRMQNSADAAAYSGGLVLTRGMNDLAFTNHLLSEVFAMTALMREARDRNSESYVPEILAAWEKVGPVFSGSNFPKFKALGPAIVQKVPREQQLVTKFGDWVAELSTRVLPLMEGILAEEAIPKYQRAVVEAFPDIAQTATRQVALSNGRPQNGRGEMLAVLWRSSGEPVGSGDEVFTPTLPVVDPTVWPEYRKAAVEKRRKLADHYRRLWINRSMSFFAHEAKMSQFKRLWEEFTCGYLKELLAEYPNSNLPHLIRTEGREVTRTDNPYIMSGHLEESFTFLAVVYWQKLPEMMPGFLNKRLFNNPMANDSVAYAQVRMFVPRRRLVWVVPGNPPPFYVGGAPGDRRDLPIDGAGSGDGDSVRHRVLALQPGVSARWDLENQHWTCQLVPATMARLSTILETPPPVSFSNGKQVVTPNLGSLPTEEIQRISPH